MTTTLYTMKEPSCGIDVALAATRDLETTAALQLKEENKSCQPSESGSRVRTVMVIRSSQKVSNHKDHASTSTPDNQIVRISICLKGQSLVS